MAAHFQGLGHMERYEYDKAVEAFREVHERAPGWIPGSINLAIALLNQAGHRGRGRRRPGAADAGPPLRRGADPARRRPRPRPGQPATPTSAAGSSSSTSGELAEAHATSGSSPSTTRPTATPGTGSAARSPTRTTPTGPPGPKQAEELIELYSKALERNPYLVPALYKLQPPTAGPATATARRSCSTAGRQLNPESNAAGPGRDGRDLLRRDGPVRPVINPFPASPSRRGAGPVPPVRPPAGRSRSTLPEGDAGSAPTTSRARSP